MKTTTAIFIFILLIILQFTSRFARAQPEQAETFFMSCDGRVVLHDISLDGNTFRESHSVDKEIMVADVMAGIAFKKGNFKFTYSYVYRTKQFKTQDYDTIFGSLSFIVFF